jgi:hypothetical protein
MAEVADSRIRVCEWEGVWKQANGANCIPTLRIRTKKRSAGEKKGIPYTNKFDFNIYGKSFLEHDALIPTSLVVATEHLVREGNLLVITRGKQTNLRPSMSREDLQM